MDSNHVIRWLAMRYLMEHGNALKLSLQALADESRGFQLHVNQIMAESPDTIHVSLRRYREY